MAETVTVPREQMAVINQLAEALKNGRLAHAAADGSLGDQLNYSRRRVRSYMSPRAARMLGKSGRENLGGLAYRDFGQQFSQPGVSDVHVDAILTDISVRYQNEDYIGTRVFPNVQVVKRSDKYFTFGAAAWLRNDAQVRAPGAGTRKTGYTVSTDNYSVETYSIGHQIPDEVRANADNPLNPDRTGAEFVANLIDLKKEKQVAALCNTSANWTTNATLSGTSQWSDYANSDPFTDHKTARGTILSQIARRANTGVYGYQTYETLALHPDLLDRCKYTGTSERPAMVTPMMLAALFDLEQVLIGSAIEDTAAEGATSSLAFVWGKHAWIGFVAPKPSIDTPSAGYVFTTGREVDVYRDDDAKSDIVRAEEAWDTKKVAAGAGYRIINATA